jgi:hypothetical protein
MSVEKFTLLAQGVAQSHIVTRPMLMELTNQLAVKEFFAAENPHRFIWLLLRWVASSQQHLPGRLHL